jgi:hypothetical protein
LVTCDATGPLPGNYDGIAFMTVVRSIPPLLAHRTAARRPAGNHDYWHHRDPDGRQARR